MTTTRKPPPDIRTGNPTTDARASIDQIRDRLMLVGERHGLARIPWARELANGLVNAFDLGGAPPFDAALAAIRHRRKEWGLPLPLERCVPLATELAEEWERCKADGLA